MKNRSLLSKYALMASLLILLVHACIKEPGPDIPLPPKPDWVLSNVKVIIARGEPEDDSLLYSATAEEYRYNEFYKPWLRIRYTGSDTNNLQVNGADTLFYDSRRRVIRMSSYTNQLHGNITRRELRFIYQGGNKYPTFREVHEYGIVRRDSLVYQDTAVYQYSLNDGSRFGYHYDGRRNFTGVTYVDSPWTGGRIDPVFDSYDNAPNVGLSLNLDHALALDVEENDGENTSNPPLFSRNNWIEDAGGNFTHRSIHYNAAGLVDRSERGYIAPGRKFTTYYQYTQLE